MTSSTPDVVVRPATLADLPQITAIYADAVLHGTATYELDPPDLAEMTNRFGTLTATGFPYFVAESEGVVLGYAYASYFRARPAYYWGAEDSIYILPSAKGKGIGKLLLRHLIEACEKLGFRQFIAVIGDGSPDSVSVKLHTAMGFEHSGTIKGSGFKHGRWLDTVIMQLELNGGTKTLPQNPPLG